MTAYLTEQEFRDRCNVPDEHVDDVVNVSPHWLSVNLEMVSREIDARLRKKYTVPFQEPIPECIKSWLVKIVSANLYLRRGIDPTDAQFQIYVDESNRARDELKEAADANTGLYDLPVNDAADASAISKAATRAYSEQSVYVGPVSRSLIAMDEDANGTGTWS